MCKTVMTAVILFACVSFSMAQKGTAGRFEAWGPINYAGDTWTGEVASFDKEKRELTLTFKRKQEELTFIGILSKQVLIAKSDEANEIKRVSDFKMNKIPDLLGLRLKVYYVNKTKKVDGEKIKTHEIFRILILPKEK